MQVKFRYRLHLLWLGLVKQGWVLKADSPSRKPYYVQVILCYSFLFRLVVKEPQSILVFGYY